MKKITALFSESKNYRLLMITVVLCLYFTNLHTIHKSVINSVELCISLILPSLFPAIFLSYFLTEYGFSQSIRKFIHKITVSLFGISGNCAEGIISGLLLGYNCSFVSAVRARENNYADLISAQRTALFFSTPGISFCVMIAGSNFLNSPFHGWILLLSDLITGLITALIFNQIQQNKSVILQEIKSHSLTEALVISVKYTSQAMLSICAWIIFFNSFIAVLSDISYFSSVSDIITIFGEITTGLSFSSNKNIFLMTLCLYFGGFCIFLQQLPLMRQLEINPLKCLIIKILNTLLSSIIAKLLFSFFPLDADVFSGNFNPRFCSVSPIGTISLILLLLINFSILASEKNNKIVQKKIN